jgi:C_GCAxxG_C_C family probable redox protein
MRRADRAVQLFGEGRACSQAVLLAWSRDLGLDDDLALRLAAPFGSGMRLGSTCGALTGALMVLGLATCDERCATREGRALTAEPIAALSERFVARVGAIDCPGILGCDVRDPETAARARAEGLYGSRCTPAVRAAAEILEDLLPPS